MPSDPTDSRPSDGLPRRQARPREPAWHVRQRRQRAQDRLVLKLVAAMARLARHHGSSPPRILRALMQAPAGPEGPSGPSPSGSCPATSATPMTTPAAPKCPPTAQALSSRYNQVFGDDSDHVKLRSSSSSSCSPSSIPFSCLQPQPFMPISPLEPIQEEPGDAGDVAMGQCSRQLVRRFSLHQEVPTVEATSAMLQSHLVSAAFNTKVLAATRIQASVRRWRTMLITNQRTNILDTVDDAINTVIEALRSQKLHPSEAQVLRGTFSRLRDIRSSIPSYVSPGLYRVMYSRLRQTNLSSESHSNG